MRTVSKRGKIPLRWRILIPPSQTDRLMTCTDMRLCDIHNGYAVTSKLGTWGNMQVFCDATRHNLQNDADGCALWWQRVGGCWMMTRGKDAKKWVLVTLNKSVKDGLIAMLLEVPTRTHWCRVMRHGWWCREPCCCVIGWEGVTCKVGRGRGRVPEGPTLLLSSSRARVRRSNCISCSRTEARRDAAFSHCSIHTERKRTGVTHSHTSWDSWHTCPETCALRRHKYTA